MKQLKLSLIICTYMRPNALCTLLESVSKQTVLPDEVLVIDGSLNNDTNLALNKVNSKQLRYFLVDENHRGLTRQRNFGISKVSNDINIVCFLDDDTVLDVDYFKNLLEAYKEYPNALGVGGYITNEVSWSKSDHLNRRLKFYYDGYMRNEPTRFRIRRKFGLEPDAKPGFLPSFSHGRSISFLPPSNKTYEVEQLMGGVSSFKKEVFEFQKFSEYFDGYGLYEDADFTLRLAKKGKLYVTTKARLAHYHDTSGRPNQYNYGKMVIRNGWYIWKVKYPNTTIKAIFKFYSTAFLLTLMRFFNIFSSSKKKEAFTESLGRFVGWLSLCFNPPKIKS